MAVRDNIKKESKSKEKTKKKKKKGKSQEQSVRQQIKTEETTLRETVREESKEERKFKPGAFTWVHMWITYIASMLMKDQRRIPDNIGNKILITNTMYVTARYMSIIIHLVDMGDNAPITYVGEIIRELRAKGNTAIVDFSFKNSKWDFKPDDSGLKSRISIWERIVSDDSVKGKRRSNAERCLYTVEQAASGKQLKQTRLYITIRAKDINTLDDALKILDRKFGSFHAVYDEQYARVKQQLEFVSILGDRNDDLKGTPAIMTSNTVMSQMVANCGSYNDWDGYYFGQNIRNGTPYYINFANISLARNMYVCAPSGVGKTVLALNVMQSAFEHGSAVCAMDIKGNEMVKFIEATGGYDVSLRTDSYEYINTFVMHPEDATRENAEIYFNDRFNFSKQQIITLSGIRDRDQLMSLEALLDEFLDYMYIYMGVERRNRNSWQNTFGLNPFVVYDFLVKFLTPSKMQQYNLPTTLLSTLGMYMSKDGSKSYAFTTEFDFANILAAPTLAFNFGILSNMTIQDIDIDLFRLKLLYMGRLNSQFTTVKFNHGIRTLKVLEESQIVNDDILRIYATEYTMSRARKQDTLLLGNSVQALMDNQISKPIIENTTALFVGSLPTAARNKVIEEFSLEHLADLLALPGSELKYKNSFVVVNMMEDKELYPIIKVQFEDPDKYDIINPSKD